MGPRIFQNKKHRSGYNITERSCDQEMGGKSGSERHRMIQSDKQRLREDRSVHYRSVLNFDLHCTHTLGPSSKRKRVSSKSVCCDVRTRNAWQYSRGGRIYRGSALQITRAEPTKIGASKEIRSPSLQPSTPTTDSHDPQPPTAKMGKTILLIYFRPLALQFSKAVSLRTEQHSRNWTDSILKETY